MAFGGTNAVDAAVMRFLAAMEDGRFPDEVEEQHVDAKEEPGRREGAKVLPGPAELEATARALYPDLACMGNTPGGGAIVLGLSKDGQRPGATVDPHVLRRRIYELSDRQLTMVVDRHQLRDGTRLLLLHVPELLEPLRVRGVLRWRYHDSCQEVDPSTWHATVGLRGRDWSLEPSSDALDDIDDDGIAAIRFFLRASSEPARVQLAEAPRDELLRRIPNLVASDGRLTHAGHLLLTRLEPAITYVHRPRHGADSTAKLMPEGPLLAQLREVLAAVSAHSQSTHVETRSGVHGQFQSLPARAVREAIVNGICHRDWHDPSPTLVEQVGQTLTVTSPGDLVGSVTVDNILTHRSLPRYRALAEALTHVRVAEREGIGVDRMFGDMLALGHPAPEISDGTGAVEVVLLGGPPSVGWVVLRSMVEPMDDDHGVADDLRTLLVLRTALDHGWVTAGSLAAAVQAGPAAAAHALATAARLTLEGGEPVLVPVEGRPEDLPPGYRLGSTAADLLADERRIPTDVDRRAEVLVAYAQDAGRVSSTEACHLLEVSKTTAIDALAEGERRGALMPSTPARRGQGFHYVVAPMEQPR